MESLIEAGRPHEFVVIPKADHSMLLFDDERGERSYTHYAPEFFRELTETARRLAHR